MNTKVLGIAVAALACSVVVLAVALLVTRKHEPTTLGFFGNPPKTEEFLKGMNDHTKQFDEMVEKMEKERREKEQSDEDK